MRLIAVVFLLVASGCAHRSDSNYYAPPVVMGPDGQPHYALTCADVTACWRRAAALCPYGYQVADSHSTAYAYTTPNPANASPLVKDNPYAVPFAPIAHVNQTTNMLIRCQAAAPPPVAVAPAPPAAAPPAQAETLPPTTILDP